MDQKIREMQERLDKIGTGRPFVQAKVLVDYSEMDARLPKAPKYQYGVYGHPAPWSALPEAKSIPIEEPKLPEPERRIRKSIDVPIASPAPISEPAVVDQASNSIPFDIGHGKSQRQKSTSYSPRTAPQSKGRSSWILWLGIALFVAIVIAQLIWVMS